MSARINAIADALAADLTDATPEGDETLALTALLDEPKTAPKRGTPAAKAKNAAKKPAAKKTPAATKKTAKKAAPAKAPRTPKPVGQEFESITDEAALAIRQGLGLVWKERGSFKAVRIGGYKVEARWTKEDVDGPAGNYGEDTIRVSITWLTGEQAREKGLDKRVRTGCYVQVSPDHSAEEVLKALRTTVALGDAALTRKGLTTLAKAVAKLAAK
jgi:hypothetical protein